MSEPVISIENLGKKYRINHQVERQRYVALRDIITEKARGLFQTFAGRSKNQKAAPNSLSAALPSSRSSVEDFWALRDVSFEVKQGEVVGIMGQNGAGKSTLLKILSRITEPTDGRVRLRGRVASLLEVGTGFHPELTGRENIFLNGAILGMHREEIKRKFDEIVAFAEVEKFLDTPVKRYSSGMYVRLAFAVAAHLEPEILIVDEVLAVGDASFQKKCLGKMESVAAQEGRTVLFVSHNVGAVRQLCSRALLLGEGRVKASGPADEVIRYYTSTISNSDDTNLRKRFHGALAGKLHFKSIRIGSKDGGSSTLISPASEIHIETMAECDTDIPSFRTTMSLFSSGVRLLSIHDVPDAESIKAGSRFKCVFSLPARFLRPAEYFVALGGHSATSGETIWATDVAQFTVLQEWDQDFRSYDHGLINVSQRGERLFINPDVTSSLKQ
jgi:lipopolysaccharide transport system ATP-binding protein